MAATKEDDGGEWGVGHPTCRKGTPRFVDAGETQLLAPLQTQAHTRANNFLRHMTKNSDLSLKLFLAPLDSVPCNMLSSLPFYSLYSVYRIFTL